MTTYDKRSPTYRFITTDLLTNTVLAEIPFRNVSYELALNDAGRFRGDVFVNSETKKLDLFNSTMPGKTGLYVMRNDECVWGGIIWSREYSVNDRSLQIEGSEFTSYLHHRTIWKTFQTTFSGRLDVDDDGDGEISLPTGKPFGIKKGSAVRLIFREPYVGLNSYFLVSKDSDSDTIFIDVGDRFYKVNQYQVTAVNSDKTIATVRLWTQQKHGLQFNDSFVLSGTGLERLDGTKTAKAVNSEYSVTVEVGIGNNSEGLTSVQSSAVNLNASGRLTINGSVPSGEYDVSVAVRTTVFDFVKGLIGTVMSDFTSLDFPNTAIEAGETSAFRVRKLRANGGIVQITTYTPHELSPGQIANVQNVDDRINGEVEVLEVIDDFNFTYRKDTEEIASTDISLKRYRLSERTTRGGVTTYVTSDEFFNIVPHDLAKGSIVHIFGVPDVSVQSGENTVIYKYNGKFLIDSVPIKSGFTHLTTVGHDDNIKFFSMQNRPNAYVEARPEVIVGTYGPFPRLSDIGIILDESDSALFDVDISTQQVRGYKLETVGEFLDTFSEATLGGTGFEYRIECRYDATEDKFLRVLRLIPLVSGLDLTLSSDSLSFLGADKLVFEFPGNVSDFALTENAEDAVTRMFVVGNKKGLSEDASQPYSAATSDALLAGWPLLDASESENDIEEEDLLADFARKYADEATPPIADLSIRVNGSLDPTVGTYTPGQWCSIIINDEYVRLRLDSDLEPLKDRLLRKIQSIEVSIPDASTFPEEVSLELVLEAEVLRNA